MSSEDDSSVDTIELLEHIEQLKSYKKSLKRERLSWRMDPKESYSDWTIEISYEVEEGGETDEKSDDTKSANEGIIRDTYHVHRMILGIGPKRCEYFVGLFQSGAFNESNSNTSHITLPQLAAEAVPSMLDYLYAHRTPEKYITTNHAVGMRHLAQYLGCRILSVDVEQFVFYHLNDSNCHIFYEHATFFADKKIVTKVQEWMVGFISKSKLGPNIKLTTIANAEFWIDVAGQVVPSGYPTQVKNLSYITGTLMKEKFLEKNNEVAECHKKLKQLKVLPASALPSESRKAGQNPPSKRLKTNSDGNHVSLDVLGINDNAEVLYGDHPVLYLEREE